MKIYCLTTVTLGNVQGNINEDIFNIGAQLHPSSFEQAYRLFSVAHPERFSAVLLTLNQAAPPAQAGPSTILTTDSGPARPTTSPVLGSDRITNRLSCSTCARIPTTSLSDLHLLSLSFGDDVDTAGEDGVGAGFLLQAAV